MKSILETTEGNLETEAKEEPEHELSRWEQVKKSWNDFWSPK